MQPHQQTVQGIPVTQEQLLQQQQQQMHQAQVQPPALLQPAPALGSLPPAPGLNVALPQMPPPGAAVPMNLAQQMHYQTQLQLQLMMQQGKLPQQAIASNPQWQAYFSMQQRALAAQAQAQAQYTKQAAAAAVAAQTAAPAGPNASGKAAGEHAMGKKAAAAAAAAAASALAMPPPAPAPKKRKLAEFKLPDKPYHILPESPLFVALQDTERLLDAAAHRRRAEVQEAYSSFRRGALLVVLL